MCIRHSTMCWERVAKTTQIRMDRSVSLPGCYDEAQTLIDRLIDLVNGWVIDDSCWAGAR